MGAAMMGLLQSAASSMAAPVSISTMFLGLNTLTSLAIVWGGGRLIGKIETKLEDGEKRNAETFERLGRLMDGIEQRVGYLEGRRG